MDFFCYFCDPSYNKNAVCCHGDFHMGNIAFSKNTNELKSFDFQLVPFASGSYL